MKRWGQIVCGANVAGIYAAENTMVQMSSRLFELSFSTGVAFSGSALWSWSSLCRSSKPCFSPSLRARECVLGTWWLRDGEVPALMHFAERPGLLRLHICDAHSCFARCNKHKQLN